jgi:hypothetical protein
MARIRIKQLNERVATMGLHMGGGPTRRKLQPGEVVEIPEDLEVDGSPLFDQLWETGTIDLTRDRPTRPLDYDSPAEAKLCSPSFKPQDPSEERESAKARERVAARLEEQFADEPEKARRKKSAAKTSVNADDKSKGTQSRRALRRQTLEVSKDGETAAA